MLNFFRSQTDICYAYTEKIAYKHLTNMLSTKTKKKYNPANIELICHNCSSAPISIGKWTSNISVETAYNLDIGFTLLWIFENGCAISGFEHKNIYYIKITEDYFGECYKTQCLAINMPNKNLNLRYLMEDTVTWYKMTAWPQTTDGDIVIENAHYKLTIKK